MNEASSSPDREDRRDRILEEALQECAGPARRRFVAEACAGDAALAAEIERLLRVYDQLGGTFLEQPAQIQPLAPKLAGTRIGRYLVEAEIGAGGAGQVYRALDTQIQRRVALKVLRMSDSSEAHRARFLRELRMLGSINHENVVQLYDSIEDGDSLILVLEHLAGQDLRAAIQEQSCGDLAARIEIARQTVAGLAHIHQAGIIHRDLKPANLFLLPTGRVKLMDFGIARAEGGGGQTVTMQIAGTPAYMAPEQLERNSDQLTAQVDVHALGITLYELFTGERAFNGDTMVRVLDQVRNQPLPVARLTQAGVPPGLCAFIAACAAKDPSERPVDLPASFERALAGGAAIGKPVNRPVVPERRRLLHVAAGLGGAAALAGSGAALWHNFLSGRAGAGIRSLAVLPFANSTGDARYDYITMGLTEGLITSLGYLSGLMVTARAAVLAYQNKTVDPREVGKRLGVQAIVTGAVALRGNAFSVTVELADTAKAAHLLGVGQTFQEDELPQAQGSIAGKIAGALSLKPGERGQAALRQQTRNGSAYQDYLYGRHSLNKRTLTGYQRAVEYFTKAVEADAGFAQAWAGLADSFTLQSGLRPPRTVFPLAKQAVEKGMKANPNVAEVHSSAGYIHLHYDWDWPAAEREFRTALEINENDTDARVRYARLLLVLGRFAEAEAELKQLRKLDPVSLAMGNTLANCYYLSRRFDEALRQVDQVLELEAGYVVAQDLRADILVMKSRPAEAIAIYEKELESQPDDAGALASLVRAAFLVGDQSKARAAVERFRKLAASKPVNPTAAAMVEIALGNQDRAIALLQEGYRQRYWPMIFLNVSPLWDSLRNRPDFQLLVKAMSLS